MITKVNILSMAVLAAIAAVSTPAPAATPVTAATVLNDVTVTFTTYSQEVPYLATNRTGTQITAKTAKGAFNTTTLLQAVATDTGYSFNPATSKLVAAKSYTDTNVYTYITTNAGVVTTNYTDNTNLLTFLSDEGITPIATNIVFTNAGTILEVVDAGGVSYPLTNGHYSFSFNTYTTDGSEKAVGGVQMTGTEAGTVYGAGLLSVNAPSNWVFSVSGFGTGTLISKNLGTGKAPVYVDLRDSGSKVHGVGQMYYDGGTVTNIATGLNYGEVLVTGTLTESSWKVILNP
ncbi:MAG: hypothetical protein ACLQVY_14705 [Limisphaerales bacterium]